MLDQKRKCPEKKWKDLPGVSKATVGTRRLNQLYKEMPPAAAEPAPPVAQALMMADGTKADLANKCLDERAEALNAALAARDKAKKKAPASGAVVDIIKGVKVNNPLWAGTYA